MANDDEKEKWNPPASPYGTSGLSDAEFKKRRKAFNEYTRQYTAREEARQARLEAKKTPEQRAKEAEDESVRRANQWSLEQDVRESTGMSIDEIRQVFSEADDLTAAERIANEALERASRAWFNREAKRRDAAKKVGKAKKDIKARKKKKSSWCVVIAIIGLTITTAEIAAIVSGALDFINSMTG